MTKLTIVTDDQGNVIAAVQDQAGAQAAEIKTSVSFAPGHRLHSVEVGREIDLAKARDIDALAATLKRHVPKPG